MAYWKRAVLRVGYAVIAIIGIWLTVNLAMPYGNHLLMAWGVGHDEKTTYEQLIFWRPLSRLIIETHRVSCDLPIATLPKNLSETQFVPSTGTAISAIAAIYNAYSDRITQNQRQFILDHLRKTIEQCDPNSGPEGIPPIVDAILMREPAIVDALVARGANVNAIVTRTKDGVVKRYTPLYFAEVVMKKVTDEKSKDAYSKIIVQLRLAGARSEHWEEKQTVEVHPELGR